MSMARTVEQWEEIFGAMGAQSKQNIAKRIFGDLTGYRCGNSCEDDDADQLANALTALCANTAEDAFDVLAGTDMDFADGKALLQRIREELA